MGTRSGDLDPSLAQWTERDLCPLARVAETAHVLLVSREVRIDTLEQLVAAAHRQPGALSYGSLGGESTTSALGESFTHALQLDITHVPYRSSAAALRDLLGGHLSMMFGTVQATLPALRGGQLRALAVSSEQRIAQLPDVPTFAELGFAEFTSKWWYGLFTPCGLTRDVEGQLISAAREAIAHPDIAAALGMDGSTQPAMTGEDFGRFVQLERIRWMPIIASLSKADAAGWTH